MQSLHLKVISSISDCVIKEHTFSTAVLGIISTISLSEAGSNLDASIFVGSRPI